MKFKLFLCLEQHNNEFNVFLEITYTPATWFKSKTSYHKILSKICSTFASDMAKFSLVKHIYFSTISIGTPKSSVVLLTL